MSDGEREQVLKRELAFALYQRVVLAMGPARRLASISKLKSLDELGMRKIERHYTGDEFEEDLSSAKGGM